MRMPGFSGLWWWRKIYVKVLVWAFLKERKILPQIMGRISVCRKAQSMLIYPLSELKKISVICSGLSLKLKRTQAFIMEDTAPAKKNG